MLARAVEDAHLRFAEFELAARSGELRRNGQLVRLQPQPFKVLTFLASRAGQVVTRQELEQAIWAGETFVDFEHGLNFCIKQIRYALGDKAHSPRFIETLPRRGYRFIAEVETIGDTPLSETAAATSDALIEPASTITEAAATSSSQPSGWRFAWLVIAALLALAGYAIWRSVNRVAPPTSRVMLAVLPFDNLSGDPAQDYFSDGMTEEMIARLGSLEPARLGVIARTSVTSYKGTSKDITSIGRELSVEYVIEGSVRREADRVRVTAQLIQVSDQSHLWSESYDRNLGGVLNVQSDVAARIAQALAIELLRDKDQIEGSTNAEAVDAYWRGRYLWNKGDRENVRKSVEHFEQAIARDPDYGAAYAGVADAYRLLGLYYAMLPAESYPPAKAAAERALELNPSLAEAYVSLGTIKFRYEWNWTEAESDFRRALEINPSSGLAHHDYGWFLIAMGRFDEGIEHMQAAQRLDPLSPLANSDVGWAYLMARRYDEAIEQINRTLELEPRFGSALACLERAYTAKGEHQQALETLLREVRNSGAEPPATTASDPIKAAQTIRRARLEQRLKRLSERRSSSYGIAVLCAAADETAAAFEWLDKAFVERDPSLVAVKTEPAFDRLRGDARFANLLNRLGLVW